jgi:hypothetical protein
MLAPSLRVGLDNYPESIFRRVTDESLARVGRQSDPVAFDEIDDNVILMYRLRISFDHNACKLRRYCVVVWRWAFWNHCGADRSDDLRRHFILLQADVGNTPALSRLNQRLLDRNQFRHCFVGGRSCHPIVGYGKDEQYDSENGPMPPPAVQSAAAAGGIDHEGGCCQIVQLLSCAATENYR